MGDPVSAFADALISSRLQQEAEYGIPVDDFDLTLNLDVFARFVKGFKGNREEPEEPSGYEIKRVLCRGMDITSLLGEEDLERLKNALCD